MVPRRLLLVVLLLAGLVPALRAATYTVNSTADTDDGVCNAANCTLREAINAANANAGTDTIRFVIGSGQKSIVPLSALPTIVDPVVIDGTTQPGFCGNADHRDRRLERGRRSQRPVHHRAGTAS